MAFREVIEAVLKAKDVSRFKAGMDTAARSVRKLGRDEEQTAATTELLKSIEEKLERQSYELAAAMTLVAHSIDDVGDEMIQASAKAQIMNSAMKKSGSNAVFLGKSWAFWKDRLSLTRSELMTTGLTIGAYFAPAIIAMGSSFAYAAIGGGGVAAGGLATLLFGLGNLALIAKPAIEGIKQVDKAQQQYLVTVEQYGAASAQASRANARLYAIIRTQGGQPVADAATNLRKLRDEWQQMSAPGRRVFFLGLSEGITTLRKIMPTFASTSHQIMVSLRSALQPLWAALQSDEILNTFRTMAQYVDRMMGPVFQTLVNLLFVFSRIIKATLPYMLQLVKHWSKVTGIWRSSTSDQKKLDNFFAGAVQHFKAWWGLARALMGTLKIVFGVSKDEGLKGVQVLTNLVNKFNEFLRAAESKGTFSSFWQAYNNSLKDVAWAIKNPIDAINKWLPRVMDAIATTLGEHGPQAALIFAKAFIHAGAWAQVLTVAWALRKFGFFSTVGKQIATTFLNPFMKAFVAGFGEKMLATSAAEGALGTKMASAGATAGGAFGVAFQIAALAAVVLVGNKVWDEIQKMQEDKRIPGIFRSASKAGEWIAEKAPMTKDIVKIFRDKKFPGGASGGIIPPGGASIVGESGRELATAGPQGTQITPLSRNSRHTLPQQLDIPNLEGAMRVTVYSYVNVDKREIGRAVSEQSAYDAARRGGRPLNG